MAQWCNPLTLQPEQSGEVGSRRGRASPLERHDKGSQTQLALGAKPATSPSSSSSSSSYLITISIQYKKSIMKIV